MDKKKQQMVILIAVGIAVLILFLFWRNRNGRTIIQNAAEQVPAFNVTIPSMNLPPRAPIIIPPIGSNPFIYEGRSACACDGQNTAPLSYRSAAPQRVTVINQGNAGPNIYNYFAPPPPKVTASATFWHMG